jgi:uncharacterized membrane protein YhaH (DUF805 family)
MKVAELFSWKGTVSRGQYALWGCILFAIKYNLDRIVVYAVYDKRWAPYYYLLPSRTGELFTLEPGELAMYRTLAILALPFIWIGTTLTLRRLRSIPLPSWLLVFFFVPFINLLFFFILCLLPSGETNRIRVGGKVVNALDRIIPNSAVGSAALALLVNVVSGVLITILSAEKLKAYGGGLFLGLPFCLGFSSVLIYGYHARRSYGSCMIVSLLSVGLALPAFLIFAIEGLVCILMAAPIAAVLALMGGTLGYFLQIRPQANLDTPKMFSILFVALPLLIAFESKQPEQATVFETRTSLIVNAPPEKVWTHVISFSELPPPNEWIFKIGIAYPIRAEIQGAGPGAVRHCVFSTGAFTEPIQIWDAPHLLKFSVTSNPAPMQEWTPYSEIHPPHLEGFLVSRGGQFALHRLSGNRTLLEGTTWYQHHMRPETYWKWWSDFIIHRIHMRVLRHVKSLSE